MTQKKASATSFSISFQGAAQHMDTCRARYIESPAPDRSLLRGDDGRNWRRTEEENATGKPAIVGNCRRIVKRSSLYVSAFKIDTVRPAAHYTYAKKRKACMHVPHACKTISNTPPYLEMNGDELRAFFRPA